MSPVKLRIKMGRGRKPKAASDAEAAAPALAAVSPLMSMLPLSDDTPLAEACCCSQMQPPKASLSHVSISN